MGNPQILPTAIGAVGSLLGGILSNEAGANSIAQQEQFQQQMSNTQWQRGVADMRAAGINPIQMYAGAQASSPTGASMQYQNPGIGLTALSSSLSTGLLTDEQRLNIEADTKNKMASVREALASAGLKDAQKVSEVIGQTYTEALERGAQADNAKKEAIAAGIQTLDPTEVGRAMTLREIIKGAW
nr:MAG: DNA pilot protein [Microviridae sp.]